MNTSINQIKVPSLMEILADVPDFRKARGIRHPLQAILTLACAAMMCGYRSQNAIAQWGSNYGERWLHLLGFTHAKAPSQPTIHRIFDGVDIALLEAKLAQWTHSVLQALDVELQLQPSTSDSEPTSQPLEATAEATALEAIAIDGKTLRGSRKQGASDAHLLSALHQRIGLVLGQVAVPDASNEINTVLELLANLVQSGNLAGKLVTADAMFTQHKIATAIVEGGGDYLLVVKDNQPLLRQDIEAVFEAPQLLGLTQQEMASMRTVQEVTMHGNRIEQRVLSTSTALCDCYVDKEWPRLGQGQVLQVKRTVTNKRTGRISKETSYAITSLSPQQATPAQLLVAWKEHWHIENKLHWIRDVTFDEDRSTVRKGRIPQVMAALRNTAIGLLRVLEATSIAGACRLFAARPHLALAALGCHLDFE
jgi:predicted transposase YbfD/YdcC